MDFSIPEEYLKYKQEVSDFASRELNQDLVARDHHGSFSHDNWIKCANFGLQGLSVPNHNGTETDVNLFRSILAMEGFGYGCKDNGLSLGLNAQMWTVQLPVSDFGSQALKEKYLPDMVSGKKIACHAITETDAGSDAYSMNTIAEKVEGGYRINGAKRLITFAPVADLILLFAYTNKKMGKWGISAFLVEKEAEGVSIGPVQHKMGMRTVPIGEVSFNDCLIPEENRVGAEGAGFSILNHSLEYDRSCILASQLGTMERQLEETIAFVTSRKQFGQPISKFQSVSNRVVEMKLRLETARLLLYKVAWLKQQGKSAVMEAAMLKLHLSESFLSSSLDAIRNFGGSGYLTESEVERNLRDAVGGVIYAGTSDIQRNIIAAMLGL